MAIQESHRDFGTTTLLVSHDISEILQLADRVIRLEHGRIVFDGSPSDAFGLSGSTDHTGVTAQHLSGPDDAGYSMVNTAGCSDFDIATLRATWLPEIGSCCA